MLDNPRTVQGVAARISQEQFLEDREIQLLVERAFEIIGEAASKISSEFRTRHTDLVPWTHVVGLRNIIAHDYGNVDYEVLWRIATTDVPALIVALGPIVSSPDS